MNEQRPHRNSDNQSQSSAISMREAKQVKKFENLITDIVEKCVKELQEKEIRSSNHKSKSIQRNSSGKSLAKKKTTLLRKQRSFDKFLTKPDLVNADLRLDQSCNARPQISNLQENRKKFLSVLQKCVVGSEQIEASC